ncbi:MAG: FAD-binding oxidoreductase [Fibrobacterota bacterium]
MKDLKKRLSRQAVETAPEGLLAYSFDASKRSALPKIVINAASAEDVIAAIQVARQYKVPVVPRGAGTGLTGGSVPGRASEPLVLNLERMDRILHIDPAQKVAVVEPGVINSTLQARLEKYGLFFPCDPSSAAFATLGGNLAENACGLRGRFYGSCYSHVAGLVYVSGEGALVSTGFFNNNRNRILQGLFIGSEGTLGVAVKLALRLTVRPDTLNTCLLFFRYRSDAFKLTLYLFMHGLLPEAMEYIDGKTFGVLAPEGHPLHRSDIEAVMLLETSEPTDMLRKVFATFRQTETLWAHDSTERAAFWNFRTQISPALYNVSPVKINEDVGVPMDRMEEFATWLDEELAAESRDVAIYTYGHLGAGCFHVNFMFDGNSVSALQDAEFMARKLFEKVMDLSGTLSCEHGIGLSKQPFLRMELSDAAYDFNRNIKKALDPDGLYNPGKIFE